METAFTAKVAVSAAPYSIDKPYDYLIPQALQELAVPGVRVTVPFGRGNRPSEGVILARGTAQKEQRLKPLTAVLDAEPVLDAEEIALALWMRQRYFCTMFEAIKTILPAGLWYRLQEVYRLEEPIDPARLQSCGIGGAEGVVEVLKAKNDSADLAALRSACGPEVDETLKALCALGLVRRETVAKRKVADGACKMVELAIPAEDALEGVGTKAAASKRCEVIRLLSSSGKLSVADACYFTGASMRILQSMEKAGILSFSTEETLRISPIVQERRSEPILLNGEQTEAFDAIRNKMAKREAAVVLLQGVTGSGKTQIYIRLVQETLKHGKNAMVLVPEIALTPQMLRTFSAYFGEQVAMLHSSLRMTERYDQWKRIRRGEARVILGTRLAVFAPVRNLGLIVMDEEQEGSYQSENAPRYHTRDIAKYLCAREQALLLLGSATPAVESTWAANQGLYQHVFLRRRYNEQSLPQVTISDQRQEIRSGSNALIGSDLRRELAETMERGEQSILLLNRRGNSRMLLCGECGYVPQCPRCSVALTYHSANGRLMCHYCGHSEPARDRCPDCGGFMKHVGSGTQKAEAELQALFPGVEVLRMDADTTAAAGHAPILRRFEQERIPILLGTQMVAKGLDFENVTLVGVLSADLSLYVDNFRAAERTFSLLTQVVGRAGRGGKQGRAVIQTYTPENDVIQCAARQDYDRFYESEIRLRRARRYPPFADLFTLTVSGTEEGRVLRSAAGVLRQLRELCASQKLEGDPEILGPAPMPVLKLNNRYRYRVFLVGKNDKPTREILQFLLKEFTSAGANRGLNLFADCNTME